MNDSKAISEIKANAYDVLLLILATTTDPDTAKLAADNLRQFETVIAPADQSAPAPLFADAIARLAAFDHDAARALTATYLATLVAAKTRQ